MTELRDWTEIDADDESEPDEVRSLVGFLFKMDWEGGLEGFLDWGGPEEFPSERLKELARVLVTAIGDVKDEIKSWAKTQGVLWP